VLSYLLYIVYTTAQIVYDTLPAVLPGEQRYQAPLEVVIPVVLARVMIAGQRTRCWSSGCWRPGSSPSRRRWRARR
jgi:hypothetical protein